MNNKKYMTINTNCIKDSGEKGKPDILFLIKRIVVQIIYIIGVIQIFFFINSLIFS